MTSLLVEEATSRGQVLTREEVIRQIGELVTEKQLELSGKIASERCCLNKTQSDTEMEADQKEATTRRINDLQRESEYLGYFFDWFKCRHRDLRDDFAPGNIMMVESREGKEIWIFYDPKGLVQGLNIPAPLDDSILVSLAKKFDVSEVILMGVGCEYYKRIRDKIIRNGSEIKIGVEGNDPEVDRVIAIL